MSVGRPQLCLAGGAFCLGVVASALCMVAMLGSGTDVVEELPLIRGKDSLEAELKQLGKGTVRVVVTSVSPSGNRTPLMWADVIERLQGDAPAFRSILSELLRQLPFEAYSWECSPTSRSTAEHRQFEFVAVDAPYLVGLEADREPFAKYLEGSRGQLVARSFPNLKGDSLFVAPAQAAEDVQVYAHAASFFRRAPEVQKDAQWLQLGEAIEEKLTRAGPTDTLWISADGSGVPWLHMRVDPRPKHYHYVPYRSQEYGISSR